MIIVMILMLVGVVLLYFRLRAKIRHKWYFSFPIQFPLVFPGSLLIILSLAFIIFVILPTDVLIVQEEGGRLVEKKMQFLGTLGYTFRNNQRVTINPTAKKNLFGPLFGPLDNGDDMIINDSLCPLFLEKVLYVAQPTGSAPEGRKRETLEPMSMRQVQVIPHFGAPPSGITSQSSVAERIYLYGESCP